LLTKTRRFFSRKNRSLDIIKIPILYSYGNASWAVDKALAMIGDGVHGTAPGQITDDGELTMSLLKALSKSENKWNLDHVARAYATWLESIPFDVGYTTLNAIEGAFSKTFSKGIFIACKHQIFTIEIQCSASSTAFIEKTEINF